MTDRYQVSSYLAVSLGRAGLLYPVFQRNFLNESYFATTSSDRTIESFYIFEELDRYKTFPSIRRPIVNIGDPIPLAFIDGDNTLCEIPFDRLADIDDSEIAKLPTITRIAVVRASRKNLALTVTEIRRFADEFLVDPVGRDAFISGSIRTIQGENSFWASLEPQQINSTTTVPAYTPFNSSNQHDIYNWVIEYSRFAKSNISFSEIWADGCMFFFSKYRFDTILYTLAQDVIMRNIEYTDQNTTLSGRLLTLFRYVIKHASQEGLERDFIDSISEMFSNKSIYNYCNYISTQDIITLFTHSIAERTDHYEIPQIIIDAIINIHLPGELLSSYMTILSSPNVADYSFRQVDAIRLLAFMQNDVRFSIISDKYINPLTAHNLTTKITRILERDSSTWNHTR